MLRLELGWQWAKPASHTLVDILNKNFFMVFAYSFSHRIGKIEILKSDDKILKFLRKILKFDDVQNLTST